VPIADRLEIQHTFASGGLEEIMHRILLSLLMITPSLFAQGAANCKQVGGAILTNFTDQTSTLGTATGDLRGGLGVSVLNVTPGPNGSTIFRVHHHWVTESGDTIILADTNATAYPTPAGVFALRYINGVQITGGTGRFEDASGTLTAFGGLDLNQGQISLRYSGQVCFKPGVQH
jgi:hypothetical protein